MSKEANLIMFGLILGGDTHLHNYPLSNKLPVSLINLPNKEYWFAPERRAATTLSFNRLLLWFGVATLLLMLIVSRYAFLENLVPSGRFSFRHIGPILLLYLVFVVWVEHRDAPSFCKKNGLEDSIKQT